MPQIEEDQAAMRLARAIASDIALYNEDKIIDGLENDTLFDVVAGELEEGWQLYKSRVSSDLCENKNFYWRAIVDVLVKGKAHIKTNIW